VRRGVVALAVLGLAVVAGCGSSSRISSADVKHLVLTKADLHGQFQPFSKGPTAGLDTQGTSRSSPGRFGRKAGWVVRFRRIGAAKKGAAIVVSTVDVFGDSGGASSDLEAYGNDFARQAKDGLAERFTVSGLGDKSAAVGVAGPGGGKTFVVAWIERNASASVTAISVGKDITLADVVSLARLQQKRLQRG
jgi:hypothetical protein